MRMIFCGVALSALLLSVPVLAAPPAPAAAPAYGGNPALAKLTDAQFNARYRCPETMSAKERDQEVPDFLLWATARHPHWKLEEAMTARLQLLGIHHCQKTLDALTEQKAPGQ